MMVRFCFETILLNRPEFHIHSKYFVLFILMIDKLRKYFSAYGKVHDAVVMKDPVTGEMVLEGGSLVLADQGN